MLCISAAYAVMRCLSVCLSSKFFSPSGSEAILVSLYLTLWHYSDGNPANRVVEYRGGMKNDDFRPISRYISEMMQYRAVVTMEGE